MMQKLKAAMILILKCMKNIALNLQDFLLTSK
jgi:hypothetical protein